MEEIWKDVTGYEGKYQVSNKGRVRSLFYHNTTRPNILELDTSDKRGYERATLSKEGKARRYLVYRLEWEAFNGPIPHGMQINHKDENPRNNNLDNLEIVDAAGNLNYGNHNKKVSQSLMNHPSFSKPVAQYSLDGVLVAVYPSMSQACRDNGFKNVSNINNCIKGKYKQAYGYKWRRE